MFNQELINLMKNSIENGEHAVGCNSRDIEDLEKMKKEGYITKYERTNNKNEVGEEEVIFYPTKKFNEL